MRIPLAVRKVAEPVGGFSEPSKMPWLGWSIPTRYCKTGGKLRREEGTVCSRCYAHSGNYGWPSVQLALDRRYRIMRRDVVRWGGLMVEAIVARARSYVSPGGLNPAFRWFDSGDLQSVKMLSVIVDVARATSDVVFANGRGPVWHWLPTKERGIVSKWLRLGGLVPFNLALRLSAWRIGESVELLPGVLGSEVWGRVGFASGWADGKFGCVASEQNNQCLGCRACWDTSVAVVGYKQH